MMMPTGCMHFCVTETATTVIYTLSLHDALPISRRQPAAGVLRRHLVADHRRPGHRLDRAVRQHGLEARRVLGDRKSTRLNSSHSSTSYAVFCLKKKRKELFPMTISGY